MILLLVSYLGGALTILSPCILPVLPFVFARADQPFVRSGLPLLLGMAITFAAVATLAAVGGGWAVQANHDGRIVAILLLAVFGLTLLFPELSTRLMQPLVNLGSRLSQAAADGTGAGRGSVVPSFILGIATGLLWAPCAGPILGLVLTGAALHGANVGTSLLLLAYAAGAATSLAIALLLGGRVFAAMKRLLGVGEWIRRGLGIAVLAGVAAIGFGVDTGLLARVSLARTSGVEQALLARVQPRTPPTLRPDTAIAALPVLGPMPSLAGAVDWLNSPPLDTARLRGKVVLVDFWTYSCINCLRTLPSVKAWAEKYRSQGLVVIGVHSPEFAFEKNVGNVTRAVHDLGVDYPVAIDNQYALWRAFDNQYWPAHYLVDARGRIRQVHAGEGDYAQSERAIQQLLTEAGAHDVPHDLVASSGSGAMAASDTTDLRTPETYVGYARARAFASPGGLVRDADHAYAAPPHLQPGQWALAGDWTVTGESALLDRPDGSISDRFHARDLHLVLGPRPDGRPVRFRVLIDGRPPQDDHGTDIDAQGNGTIGSQRLYQLVRQSGPVGDREFRIEFLDPGAQAFAFTFG